MASSPSWSPAASLDDPNRGRYLRTSTDDSDDDSVPSRIASRSRVRTKENLRAICRKYSIPDDFTPVLAGDRSPCAPPPPGSVCVYVDALVAGMRLPLHPFYGTVLSHFGIAPGQLTPNGWRALAGFVVLSHFTGVPPSLAVFRHFFVLCTFQKKLYSFRGKEAVGLLFRQLTLKNQGWKKEFFFLSSSARWPCPVHWGLRSAKYDPELTGAEKVVAANLLRARGGSPIELRMYLSESNMVAASIIGQPSPPPTLQGMGAPVHQITMEDIRAEKAAEVAAARASAEMAKVKCEPGPDYEAPPFAPSSGKKRKLAEEHAFGENSSSGHSSPPGFSTLKTPSNTSEHRDGDTTDWKAARQLLQGIVPPWRERELAASKPADVVASSYTSVLQAANEVAFSLGYARELEKKLRAREREADALREELREAKAELAETKTNAEMAKTAERGFSGSEHARALAERELRGYERGMEDMKRAALRRYPHLDPAWLVVPLHMPTH